MAEAKSNAPMKKKPVAKRKHKKTLNGETLYKTVITEVVIPSSVTSIENKPFDMVDLGKAEASLIFKD